MFGNAFSSKHNGEFANASLKSPILSRRFFYHSVIFGDVSLKRSSRNLSIWPPYMIIFFTFQKSHNTPLTKKPWKKFSLSTNFSIQNEILCILTHQKEHHKLQFQINIPHFIPRYMHWSLVWTERKNAILKKYISEMCSPTFIRKCISGLVCYCFL